MLDDAIPKQDAAMPLSDSPSYRRVRRLVSP